MIPTAKLLELRVHGVNNTLPVAMLDPIVRTDGDTRWSVWRLRNISRHEVRAFSWGGIARIAPMAGARIPGFFGGIFRATWIFLIPFGLVNVAYWSRRLGLSTQTQAESPSRHPSHQKDQWSGYVRLFSILLTLLFVSTIATISVSMFWQVYLDGISGRQELPPYARFLEGWNPGKVLAAISLVPVSAIGAVWFVAWFTRRTYNQDVDFVEGANNSHWFARKDFWGNGERASFTATLHVAAGISLVTAWTAQVWRTEGTRLDDTIIGISIVTVLVACLCVWSMPSDLYRRNKYYKYRHSLLVIALGVFIVQFATLTTRQDSGIEDYHADVVGLNSVPGLLVLAMFSIAISGLHWRRTFGRHISQTVVFGIFISGIIWLGASQRLIGESRDYIHVVFAGVLLAVVIGWIAWSRYGWVLLMSKHKADRDESNGEAWGGTAPGVFLILALFSATLLSSLAVTVASAVILWEKIPAPWGLATGDRVEVPTIYSAFSMSLTFTLSALLVLVSVACVILLRTPPSVEPGLEETTLPPTVSPNELACQRKWKRKCASLAHRAEPLVGVLTVIAVTALVGSLLFAMFLHLGWVSPDAGAISFVVDWSNRIAIVLGALLFAFYAKPGSRPLGLVWDLICFLPRAGHPFGPPCYAQKAVPELTRQCREWLAADTGNRLLLSVHSQGCVLAVASILNLNPEEISRIGLLTYGSQLRAYFGRIFPELLGPVVLGNQPSRAAGLFREPPFCREDTKTLVPDDAAPITVYALLSASSSRPRWRNLWRPTDYLGFPVYSRAPVNPIDRPADEVVLNADWGSSPIPMEFASHSDYWRTPQYRAAVAEFAEKEFFRPSSSGEQRP